MFVSILHIYLEFKFNCCAMFYLASLILFKNQTKIFLTGSGHPSSPLSLNEKGKGSWWVGVKIECRKWSEKKGGKEIVHSDRSGKYHTRVNASSIRVNIANRGMLQGWWEPKQKVGILHQGISGEFAIKVQI